MARERNRNDFFDSLRRKSMPTSPSAPGRADETDASMGRSSTQPVSPQSAASASQEDDYSGTPEKSEAAGPSPQKAAPSTAEATSGHHRARENGGEPAMANGGMNGHSGGEGSTDVDSNSACKLFIPAEEEAFLRSLGWEESDDHNEGAPSLTNGSLTCKKLSLCSIAS